MVSSKRGPGQPLKFKNKSALAKAIARYFRDCDPHIKEIDHIVEKDGKQEVVKKKIITKQVPYTITGLAMALDTSRRTLLNYEAKEEYFHTIKKAKVKCENYAEGRLFVGGQQAGPIFNLKNNYPGWKEKTELVVGGLKKLLDEIYEDKQPLVNPKSGDPRGGGDVRTALDQDKGQEVENKQSILD